MASPDPSPSPWRWPSLSKERRPSNTTQPPYPPRRRPAPPNQRPHDAAPPAHPVAAVVPGMGPREDICDIPTGVDPAVPARDVGCRK
ncbi:hypothetical protein V502_08032, partial [Pseudogymnoascus sp. VKM F-4520 (FW-2644)]